MICQSCLLETRAVRMKSENMGELECLVSPAIARPGVCELLMVEFWASNPHRSDRIERDYHRTIVFSAAWLEIVICTLFCMACRLGGIFWPRIHGFSAVNILTHLKSSEHHSWIHRGFPSPFLGQDTQIRMDKDG